MDNEVTVPIREQLEKWFDIFNKKRKFEWLTFEDCQKKDGIYYKCVHWQNRNINEIKKAAYYYLYEYQKPFFSTIDARNGKVVRLANNIDIDDIAVEKAKELFKDFHFVYISKK